MGDQLLPRRTLIAVTAACAAVGVIPSSASAAGVTWRCEASPLSGTLLGRPLPLPTAGSTTEDCADDATLPTLQLPAPLDTLLKVDLLNGVTSVDDKGAFAAGGLAHVKVGSLPIPVGDIPIPDALKALDITLPGTKTPVATVDLSPAIEAIKTLPSKDLLDASALYSGVSGTCQDGRAVLAGTSRVLNADVLGLPVDASKTVDSAINLVDTAGIALNTLDLSLAKVTLLGGTVDVNTGTVLNALKPILDQLPPIAVPPALAHVKLTASGQETVDGMLVQRALRAQISLGGQSIADLTVGKAAVGGGEDCAPPAAPPQNPALECTTRKLALIDVLPEGDHVRLYGAADRSLAGKTVNIVFKATKQVVARVPVGKDGAFTTTAPMPAADIRATNRARYIAKVGGEKSLKLKLMRRMVVKSVRSHGDKVTITGRVVEPLALTPQTITLKRRVTCRKLETVKRFKPNRRRHLRRHREAAEEPRGHRVPAADPGASVADEPEAVPDVHAAPRSRPVAAPQGSACRCPIAGTPARSPEEGEGCTSRCWTRSGTRLGCPRCSRCCRCWRSSCCSAQCG